MARILVTGSKGFIGKNLVAELDNRGFDVFECGRETSNEVLEGFCKDADFVFHLAGVNRPSDPEEFIEGNVVFTSKLLETLKKNRNFCPVVFSSSIQATQDSPYGLSKRMGEKLVFEHGRSTRSPVLVYRLPNVFGKWCKPDYNSVIATFCYNISRDIPIKVTDPDKEINLVYIDDLVGEFINAIKGNENRNEEFCEVQPIHTITLSKIADLIYSFRQSRVKVSVPDMSNPLTKKLYSTYLSYLPENQFGYTLKTNVDFRGSFTEFIRTPERGQVSINISKPGVVKGNHWHHTKVEKFLVVSGKGVIRLRKIGTGEVTEYEVSGDILEVIDIPPGYTHNIENLGESDMVTIMWANEPFDPKKPDTWYMEV